jgi:hypothetical protein
LQEIADKINDMQSRHVAQTFLQVALLEAMWEG